MVSRRNFFAMVLTMLILFFMFQFTGIAKNALNEYGINEYADIPSASLTADSMYWAETGAGERPYILFAGGGDSDGLRTVVRWWCTYTKRGMEECGDPADYRVSGERLPQALVLDGKDLDLERSLPVLKELTDRGIHLILARMPSAAELGRHPEFCEFIGIREVHRERVTLRGVHLFDGFLLGGERIYESKPGEEELMDLELEVPWYMTGTATKTYMMGLLGESGEYENEMLPALVWRKSERNASVFCVNTDAVSHMYGIGFLSAMMAESSDCEIYPVVNAQNLAVVNYAGFAEENEARMKELYSQSQTAVYRELIWPALVSVTERSSRRMTLLAAPQFDYADGEEPESARLTYYLKLLKEAHGELGISADPVGNIDLAGKLSRDEMFFRQWAKDYALLSLYVQKLDDLEGIAGQSLLRDVRTVTTERVGEEPVISYLDADTTLQYVTDAATVHSYSDDLALMGIETALGYSNILMDLKEVSDPPTPDYYWENLSRKVSKNVITYWKSYRCFEGTTLAESDARVRRFLAMDYRAEKQKDRIVLRRTGAEGAVWFLLKLNSGTVRRMEGGTCEAQKGGFYLIGMDGEEAVIELAEKRVGIRE